VGLVAVPSLAQWVRPRLLTDLRCDPEQVIHQRQWWRLLTAVAVQDGGAVGSCFNLATLAVVAVLACRAWGGPRALVLFACSAALLNGMATASGAGTAGSSGATFALASSIAGLALVRSRGAGRLRAGLPIAIGAVILALGNPHGIAVLTGAALGILTEAASPTPAARNRSSGARPQATLEVL